MAQVASTGPHVVKPGFESNELLGGQLADSMAGRGSTVTFPEDIGEFVHRKSDG
jgi:hypothetical protein